MKTGQWYGVDHIYCAVIIKKGVDRGRDTGIRGAESGVEGAESGVEGVEAGVEGAGSGDRGGGESGKIGRELDFFLYKIQRKWSITMPF